ncbi:putative HIT finger domain protein [Aspergillus foveolatus]|uniref:putative HIT finger domain protein n=1 Tax=Aspergillus foveolatus TaxID=210207 RepID=UPI003CCE439F
MYRVEVLPNASKSNATPGWTYVPDKGFDPAKAAIAPTTGRKRGIRDPARTDLSSRQANAIVRHLAELDRENHRDVAIAIPARKDSQPRESATRGTRTKVTSNVRRILQSQKTFRNYLDDEEAALAQASSSAGTSSIAAQRLPSNRITKPSSSLSRRSATPAIATPKPDPRAEIDTPSAQNLSDTANIQTADSQIQPNLQEEQKPDPNALIKSQYDNDPLLKSYIPSAPSERIMRALLAEPPLSYNASRAGPPLTGKAPRKFCCICGYWGKIRCRNCHQRTCGIECYKTHEDSRCGAFF